MEKVTIVIPFYNAEKYIKTCIKTLQNQTYKNFKAMFIDDGSTDNTVDEIEKINDARFVVLKQLHKGVSAARNLALKNIESKYIAFMDIDDELVPEYFEKLVSDMEKENSDIVLCNYAEVYSNQKKNEIHLPWKDGNLKRDEIEDKLLPLMIGRDKEHECIRGCIWRTFIRLDFYNKYNIKFDEEVDFAEDLLFLLELYNKANKIYIESKILYLYHKNAESTMNQYRVNSLFKNLEFHKKLIEVLKKENIFNKNIERYKENRANMYTVEISNLVRVKNHAEQKQKIAQLREVYVSDNISMQRLENITLGRKISLILLKYKMYNLLLILYTFKEKIRLRSFFK